MGIYRFRFDGKMLKYVSSTDSENLVRNSERRQGYAEKRILQKGI